MHCYANESGESFYSSMLLTDIAVLNLTDR